MTRALSVCALLPYPVDTTPSQRFRIEQWMPHLEGQGITVDVLPFADAELMQLLPAHGRRGAKALAMTARLLRRSVDVIQARKYDVVLVHRAACIAGPALFERMIAAVGRPVVYDFDDAIFRLHTTEANRRFGWLKFPGKTASICRLSAHVVVGNAYLADYARQYNRNVSIVPTSIDTMQYRPSYASRDNRRVVVGWTGSSTSQTHLEMFSDVLRRLGDERDFDVRVISNREPRLPGVRYDWRPWSADTEVGEIGAFDIGIMPMPDDEWARGKCALKALQYMAMGIPTVCSAVGTNREVIQHGTNGLLASSDEDWLRSLESLIDDGELRTRLGQHGRETVERGYSMHRCAEMFGDVVRAVVSR